MKKIFYSFFILLMSCQGGQMTEDAHQIVVDSLNIDIKDKCVAPLSFSEFDYKNFQLLLLLYVCRRWDGEPMSMENNKLEWVKPNMLRDYKMPPADDALIYCLQDLF